MNIPKWKESYNCHRLLLAETIEVNVKWDSLRSKGLAGGYRISVGDRSLTEKAPTLAEGKMRALRLADKVLREVREQLIEVQAELHTEKK